MERIGDRAAHDAARGAVRVLDAARCSGGRWCWLVAPCLRQRSRSASAGVDAAASRQAAGSRLRRWPRVFPRASRLCRRVSSTPPKQPFAPSSGRRRPRFRPTQPRHRAAAAGRHADALVEFRTASRLDPAFGPPHLLAGTSLLALGQAKAAVAELGIAPRADAARAGRAPSACRRLRAHQRRRSAWSMNTAHWSSCLPDNSDTPIAWARPT